MENPKDLFSSKKGADARYKELKGKVESIHRRCEDYALWTLPYIFPIVTSNSETTERQGPIDSIGARAVNNLANKIVTSLFPLYTPFMRLEVASDELEQIKSAAMEGDPEATEIMAALEKSLVIAEDKAMRRLNYNKYRTEAVTVAKALIITGNSMIYHPVDGGPVQVYSLRDYVVVRDLNGSVIEFITCDQKAFGTFSQEFQDKINKAAPGKYKTPDKEVKIYTHVKLATDGKYYMEQYADKEKLDSKGMWAAEDLPWIILTWNLLRGENYGRGLVEDYAGAFHGLHVLGDSFVSAVGVACDIKWLVKPSSMLDPVELNKAPSGSYHVGEEGDLTAAQLNKQVDFASVEAKIADWRQQVGQAFLLFSAVQRDAERVTAEEIRQIITDLEGQHSGIYSRFADEWQLPTARLVLRQEKIRVGTNQSVYPRIITGLDSLSRAGDMYNLRVFMEDMSLLNNLPESVQADINVQKYAAYCGTRRGVDYEMFMKTPAEKQAEYEQQAQMQMGMQQQEQFGNAAAQAAASELKG